MNEICLLIGSYLLIEFTQYEIDGEFRYKIGWLMTALMAFSLCSNVGCILFNIVNTIVNKVREFINKKKMQE